MEYRLLALKIAPFGPSDRPCDLTALVVDSVGNVHVWFVWPVVDSWVDSSDHSGDDGGRGLPDDCQILARIVDEHGAHFAFLSVEDS